MKSWSRYNTLFRSDKFGRFLYNSLSGVMLELDEAHYLMAETFRDGQPFELSEKKKTFISFLEEKRFLIESEKEKLQLMELRYKRNLACFNTASIGLTICPTLACNFACPYCYEKGLNDPTVMSPKTIDALLSFIKKHKDARNLSVSWYGGEPTLAFDVIKILTKRFLELYPDYDNAALVTNAYLLDKKKINLLEKLKITSIQITVDGSESTHDSRRMLKNGNATYRKTLDNIDALMQSSWKGHCTIRVNIDRTNRHEYAALRTELLDRYNGKKITVYPGYVQTFLDHTYEHRCGLCNSEWAAFTVESYTKNSIIPRGGFYPVSGTLNTCVATIHYGYVVGPKGELYKCWEDVGKESMVIGSVLENESICNPELVSRYSIGTDPFNDSVCMDCSIMPICGGGCVNRRMRVQQFGEKDVEFCSPFKDSLTSNLEAYIDIWRTQEICIATLRGGSSGLIMKQGYRMIQPKEITTKKAE